MSVNYRGTVHYLGLLPLDFMLVIMNWTQVFIRRPTLRKHVLLPKDSVFKNLNKIDDLHAAQEPINAK